MKDTQEYVGPVTATEEAVCKVWQEALGLDRVGVTDDFFRIGGDSILAIIVSHRMGNMLGCEVRVADVFRYKNISQLLTHSLGQQQTSIPKTDAKVAVLSFAQERLWFLEQYEGGSNAYHLPLVYELDASCDKEGMIYALRQVVSRHEVLRSTIEQMDNLGKGIQRVHEDLLPVEERVLSDEEVYETAIRDDINRPFDLAREYPIRVRLYLIRPDEAVSGGGPYRRVLLINSHHIATDGWSGNIFAKELLDYYEAYIKDDTTFRLPALEMQYKDYAVWHRAYLTGEVLQEQLSYWKEKLSGYQTLGLLTDFTRPKEINYSGASKGFVLSKELSQRLRTLAHRLGTTMHNVLLSSINILLSKYTGQEDIVIGSPIANRHHRQTEDLIGYFVNMQANRSLLNKAQSYEELIGQVHQDQMKAQLHQDLPFEKIVDTLGVQRDTSRHPIFQVMFNVQSFGNQAGLNLRLDKYFKERQIANLYNIERFDLSIYIDDSEEELMGQISYATSLFTQGTIARLIECYMQLLAGLIKNPDKSYHQLSLLSAEEYDKIVYEWNATDTDYPKDRTIYEVFIEQASKTPDNIALVYEGQELTYKELDEKSNQLARHIRSAYEQRTNESLLPDTLIALFLDRSLEMVIGILAVMKAGGAYVPIDTGYPQERIDYMLTDTGAELVLSQRHLGSGIKTQLPQQKVLYIGLAESLYDDEDSTRLPRYSTSTDLAYVIYTSGTTGKPKGVMIEHSNVIRLFTCSNHQFGFNSSDVWTLFHSYVFDFSVWELWGALMYGGKLIIIPVEETKDIERFFHRCRQYKVSVLNQTPSAFYRYADIANSSHESSDDLRYVILGGEALNTKQLKHWWAYHAYGNQFTKLINMYGITETTVHVTYKELVESDSMQSNIGKPLADEQTYVLDSSLQPVPIGVTGELYIGGAGLARGYLNNEALTAERFIVNPFAREAGIAKGYTRLYKSGDLVRWLPDGNLEFMGRNDDQVKIRGYRMELGEIEHALSQIPGIRQNCVLAKERQTESGSHKYLVGYYVAEDSHNAPTQSVILDQLSKELPEYMLPGILVRVESFPLTVNGKLDRQALTEPDFTLSAEEYVGPATATEEAVCKVWQEALGLDRVGVTDDFFRIGGNSILAIIVSHRMSKVLGCEVRVGDVFRYKNINTLLSISVGVTLENENIEWEA